VLALAPAQMDRQEPGAQGGGHQERQADIQACQPGTEKRADGVADIGQGVFDREGFAALLHWQALGKAGLDRDVEHRIGEVDQHQAQVEQPQLAGREGADKAQGEQRAAAEDQAVAGGPVHQEAAIEAQQRTQDQAAADHQADVADLQVESAAQVDHQIGQGDGPGQGQHQGAGE